jgi:glycosyltransferase involved in cell wall biosynthesis
MSSLTASRGSSDETALDTSECLPDGGMRVAIVHDYLTQRGGAERVVLAMLRAFPDAELHTSLYEPASTFPEFRKYRVHTLPVNAIRPLRSHHRAALPLLAPAFSAHRVDADLVICSSSGWAHGVRTTGRKLVYWHSPAKWLYTPEHYRAAANRSGALLLSALRSHLERWDRRAVRTVHRHLCNSSAVRNRLRSTYALDAEVLHPPCTLVGPDHEEHPLPIEPGFLLCVSRLLPYKNVENVIDSMRYLPKHRLVVVGEGPLERPLRAAAPHNVAFVARIKDAELAWLYANSTALVHASYEDYGLTPIEAASAGRPSVVLRAGGFIDTVIDGVTGIFFDDVKASSIAAGVDEAMCMRWDRAAIQMHAATFSEEAFIARLRAVASEEVQRE